MSEPERGSTGSALAMAGPLLLAVVATAVGARILGERLPSAWYAAVIVTLLLFFALLTFKQTRGWNTGLLTALAAMASGFAGAFFPNAIGWGGAIAAALLGLSAIASRRRWAAIAQLGRLGWILSWAYLVGWPVLAFLDARREVRIGWAAGGLVLFAGLATGWFASRPWQGQARQDGTPAAIEVYLIGLNLLVAGAAVVEWLE